MMPLYQLHLGIPSVYVITTTALTSTTESPTVLTSNAGISNRVWQAPDKLPYVSLYTVAAIIRGGTSYGRGVESMLSMTQDASWAKWGGDKNPKRELLIYCFKNIT